MDLSQIFKRYLGALVGIILGLSIGSVADGAAVKRLGKGSHSGARKTMPAAPDPIRLLSSRLATNSLLKNETPLDVCARSNFKGLLLAFDNSIHRLSAGKSEFESTPEFEDRQEVLTNALNQIGDVVACAAPTDNLMLNYDADRENFELSFDGDLILAKDFKRTGSYQSKTRMGARAIVTSYLSINYRLDSAESLKKQHTDCLASTSYGPNKMYFYVPAVDARNVKESGIIAITGKIIPPFFEKDERSGNPTLDDPSDVYSINLRLKFQLKSIIVYSSRGVELTRCSF